MSSSLNISRRQRAFDEGRRAAFSDILCPYQNKTLVQIWNKGRSLQLTGTLRTDVPRLKGEQKTIPIRPPTTI